RRLFYVALTRAQDELYLIYPLIDSERGRQTVIQRPSRFVIEVPRELFEVWDVGEESVLLTEGDGWEEEKPRLLN
ncbi:MAG: hypothetical protein ACKV2V_06155, partial [Blastocatellia bacterium]